jgi:hypothetical protein
MRKSSLIWIVPCDHLTVQRLRMYGKVTGPQDLTRSHGVIHRSCANHFPRTISAKPWRIVLQRADGANASAGTGFRGIEIPTAPDAHYLWFCPAKQWSSPISPLTLESIWGWCWQDIGSLGQWIERTESPRSSFCVRPRFGNRNSRMNSKPSREIWISHTDRPSILLGSQVFPLHFSRMDWFFHFTPPRKFPANETYPTRKSEAGSGTCFSRKIDRLLAKTHARDEWRIDF